MPPYRTRRQQEGLALPAPRRPAYDLASEADKGGSRVTRARGDRPVWLGGSDLRMFVFQGDSVQLPGHN